MSAYASLGFGALFLSSTDGASTRFVDDFLVSDPQGVSSIVGSGTERTDAALSLRSVNRGQLLSAGARHVGAWGSLGVDAEQFRTHSDAIPGSIGRSVDAFPDRNSEHFIQDDLLERRVPVRSCRPGAPTR